MANTRPRFSNSDLTNAYFNAAKSTAATTGHLLLDSDDARASGARHGHILQVLDIKNDSGADGSIYLGGAFESQILDEQGESDPDFLWERPSGTNPPGPLPLPPGGGPPGRRQPPRRSCCLRTPPRTTAS